MRRKYMHHCVIAGPNSLFIRVLLDKKYALPYQVVDGLWSHFVRLANTHKGSNVDGGKLPVLWHQSLLVFCQRYVGLIFYSSLGTYAEMIWVLDMTL